MSSLCSVKISLSSNELRAIIDRKNELIASFLSFGDSPADSLTEESQDKLRAFKVFMHAELEVYFENIVKKIILNCKNSWTSTGLLNSVLVMMLIYNKNGYTGNQNECNATERINRIFEYSITDIGSNHGIKEKDISKLLQQIGVNLNNHQILKSELESYGSSRGEIVHNNKSYHSAVRIRLIKANEVSKIDKIIELLLDLDLELIAFLHPINYLIKV